MFLNLLSSSRKWAAAKLDNCLRIDRCALCLVETRGFSLCDACLSDLPLWDSSTGLELQDLDRIFVGYRYEYPIDRLVRITKYPGNISLANTLGKLAREVCELEDLVWGEKSTFYPTPISRWRRFRRGFNQSAVITSVLNTAYKRPVDEVSIYKRSFLPDQSSLDKDNRRANALGIFGFHPNFKAAEHAIIVDDVITTGATLSTIASGLRKHGSRRVDAVTFAAVP
ncbi:MAG: phosphoribosyltransferase family protein [Pseudomonadota bacterium]